MSDPTIQELLKRIERLEGRGPLMGVMAVKDATTNTVKDVLRLKRGSTGTAADGEGVGVIFVLQDASGNEDEVASIDAVLTTAAHATQAGEVRVYVLGVLRATINSAGLVTLADALQVNGNTTLGNASTDLITCTGRLIMRTVASDPQDATPANRPVGSVAEIVYYGGKTYFCADLTPTWQKITSS